MSLSADRLGLACGERRHLTWLRMPCGLPAQGRAAISLRSTLMLHVGHVSVSCVCPDHQSALCGVVCTCHPGVVNEFGSSSEVVAWVCAGCGKSTLMMSIYRIVEPCGGKVTIDGQDICQMGLFDLRSRLALVPQVGKLCIRG